MSRYTVAPVVFGAAVIQYAPALATTVGGRYIYGNNVYLSTAVGTFNTTPPTSTDATLFTSSGPSLMWIGTNGNIGTNLPYGSTLSLTTQYFVGDFDGKNFAIQKLMADVHEKKSGRYR